MNKLEDYARIAATQLYERYKFQCTAVAKQFPLLMSGMWQGSENLKPNDSVEPVLKHGTLSIGFIGLAECLIALTGIHHGESEKSQELGIEIKYLESKQDSDYATNVETLADEEGDLIIGVGSKLSDTIKEAAKNYPDQKFAIIDETYDEIPSNVTPIVFKANEAAYLTGLIAGRMTETN